MTNELFDEKLGKIMAQALDPRGSDAERLAALNGAVNYLKGRDVHFSEVAICYKGQDRFGFSRLLERATRMLDDSIKSREETAAIIWKYRQRMAALEAAFTRMKKILRNIDATDGDDQSLKSAAARLNPEREIEP